MKNNKAESIVDEFVNKISNSRTALKYRFMGYEKITPEFIDAIVECVKNEVLEAIKGSNEK